MRSPDVGDCFKSQAFALFVEIYEGDAYGGRSCRTCILDRGATKLRVPEHDIRVPEHDI
ncbi:hypothetical protein [Nostoc sp.]|uniref:hypothetical protein n=1 Tax=Nostoc sp. TaxID=1180 RepID=UPI002FF87CAF